VDYNREFYFGTHDFKNAVGGLSNPRVASVPG